MNHDFPVHIFVQDIYEKVVKFDDSKEVPLEKFHIIQNPFLQEIPPEKIDLEAQGNVVEPDSPAPQRSRRWLRRAVVVTIPVAIIFIFLFLFIAVGVATLIHFKA